MEGSFILGIDDDDDDDNDDNDDNNDDVDNDGDVREAGVSDTTTEEEA